MPGSCWGPCCWCPWSPSAGACCRRTGFTGPANLVLPVLALGLPAAGVLARLLARRRVRRRRRGSPGSAPGGGAAGVARSTVAGALARRAVSVVGPAVAAAARRARSAPPRWSRRCSTSRGWAASRWPPPWPRTCRSCRPPSCCWSRSACWSAAAGCWPTGCCSARRWPAAGSPPRCLPERHGPPTAPLSGRAGRRRGAGPGRRRRAAAGPRGAGRRRPARPAVLGGAPVRRRPAGPRRAGPVQAHGALVSVGLAVALRRRWPWWSA